jgi:RNA polymerase sigma factor (sigma-70 family)
MPSGSMHSVIEHLRRAVLLPDSAALRDGELLGRFVERHDEAALAALVRRHGPMVWGVCRRALHNHHDAEDAFQATFLVLVRKAASIVPREMVGNWLYGVAHQTALQARRTAARRRAREVQVTKMPDTEDVRQDQWSDLQPVLDEELSRLPDRYRAVIVLCDLEGRTRKEVARQLGVPDGTVGGRLARARAMLAKRLARRGVTLSGGALAAMLSLNAASAGVPASVVISTTRAASCYAAGQTAASVIAANAASLTEGVVKAMLVSKLKVAAAAVLAVAALFGSIPLFYRTLADEPAKGTDPIRIAGPNKDGKDAVAAQGREPEWVKKFHVAYQLKEGEYVKRVPSPFIPERRQFVSPRFPGAADASLDGLLTMGVLFADADGETVAYRAMVSTDATDFDPAQPTKQVREKRLPLRSVIAYSTGRLAPEVMFDEGAKDQDVIMECDLVIRSGAPLDKLLPDLQKAIGQCGTVAPKTPPVFSLKAEEQEVYVVSGKFKITPRKWRDKGAVDVYADEAVLNKTFTEANPEPTEDVTTSIDTVLPLQFVRELGAFVNRRMVWEAEAPPSSPFRAFTHSRWEEKATAEERAADRDPAKVLKNVSEQTGLSFKKEKRMVQILYVTIPR